MKTEDVIIHASKFVAITGEILSQVNKETQGNQANKAFHCFFSSAKLILSIIHLGKSLSEKNDPKTFFTGLEIIFDILKLACAIKLYNLNESDPKQKNDADKFRNAEGYFMALSAVCSAASLGNDFKSCETTVHNSTFFNGYPVNYTNPSLSQVIDVPQVLVSYDNSY